MKNIRKVLSLFLVCVILSNLMWFNANAAVVENYTFTERNVGSNIEWTITNNKTAQTDVLLFILEDDGNTSTYGWLNTNITNMQKERTLENSDFHTAVVNGNIIYSDKTSAYVNVGSIPEEASDQHNSYAANITYPTSWSSETSYSNVGASPGSSVSVVVSILAALMGVGAGGSVILALAQYIVGNGLSTIYYRRVRWSRLLDLLTQEYYSVYTFYKNSNYTNQYGEYTTPHQTVYLG